MPRFAGEITPETPDDAVFGMSLTPEDQLALATEYKRIMSHNVFTKTDIQNMLMLTKVVLDQTFYKKD